MPLVKIDLIQGARLSEEIKKLANVIQRVMLNHFNAPERDRSIPSKSCSNVRRLNDTAAYLIAVPSCGIGAKSPSIAPATSADSDINGRRMDGFEITTSGLSAPGPVISALPRKSSRNCRHHSQVVISLSGPFPSADPNKSLTFPNPFDR